MRIPPSLVVVRSSLSVSKDSKTDNHLNSLSLPAPGAGYAVGAQDTILRTVDYGETWTVGSSGLSRPCVSSGCVRYSWHGVSFHDRLVGWLVGSYGKVLQTVDGGDTWSPQTVLGMTAAGGEVVLRGVQALTAQKVVVVGDRGTLLRTGDAGRSWELAASRTAESLRAVHFVNETWGWVVGDLNDRVLHTKVAIPLSAVHKSQGCTYGEATKVVRTDAKGRGHGASGTRKVSRAWRIWNAQGVLGLWGVVKSYVTELVGGLGGCWPGWGFSWGFQGPISGGGSLQGLAGVFFVDASQGWVVGGEGNAWMASTRDGGASWQASEICAEAGPLLAVTANAGTGYGFAGSVAGKVCWSLEMGQQLGGVLTAAAGALRAFAEWEARFPMVVRPP
ncbi:hypothetical protein CYMTET_24747 [Cymbomonas tetramitiformis]|uniref:Photosynthesis system II assembly factor Ycf48/Hcf136-like domain-containing protein n=1 Tax=Cymbomonas tetramitiformis TaxID=36881 RepID=A0AAE0FV96_9CHLO|nr:hypothetical protein CYMTET_24747 [Cymbomonas tetramitiformis]